MSKKKDQKSTRCDYRDWLTECVDVYSMYIVHSIRGGISTTCLGVSYQFQGIAQSSGYKYQDMLSKGQPCIQFLFNINLMCIRKHSLFCYIVIICLNGNWLTDSHTPNLEMLLHEFTLNSIRKMGFECIFYNIRKIGYDCMLNSIRKVGYEHKLNCIRKLGMSVDSITNFCCTILHAA